VVEPEKKVNEMPRYCNGGRGSRSEVLDTEVERWSRLDRIHSQNGSKLGPVIRAKEEELRALKSKQLEFSGGAADDVEDRMDIAPTGMATSSMPFI
jgi:hypothetical protein